MAKEEFLKLYKDLQPCQKQKAKYAASYYGCIKALEAMNCWAELIKAFQKAASRRMPKRKKMCE
jgi:hypothetical protein